MPLPKIDRSQLDMRPVDLDGLPKRYMNPGELEVLIALVDRVQPRAVLEIGCNEGRTAAAILRNVPSIERYQGIDVLPGYRFDRTVQRNEVPKEPGHLALHDPRFALILRPRGTFELTAVDLAPCDVAFIDGDHGRRAVLRDTALARQLVRPGGIIIWHDYHHKGTVDVGAVLDEMHNVGHPIRHVDGTWLAFMNR